MTRLFKIVDNEAAPLVLEGSVKLGTAKSYAALEDHMRRDTLDSSVEYRAAHIQTTGLGDVHDAAAENVSIRIAPGVVGQIRGCSAVPSPPRRYVYCVTRAYAHQVRPAQAVFEVFDIEDLAKTLQSLDSRLGWYKIDWVEYAARQFDAYEMNVEPDPFIKRPKFRPECEARITFDAVGDFNEAGLIVSDTQLGRFFRRLDLERR